jgi:signal transduction histidine kinase
MKKRFRLIIVAFSVSFAVMASLSLYSLKQFSTLTGYSDQVDHTNKVITVLYKIEIGIKEYDIQEQSFMLHRDTLYIQRLTTITKSVSADIHSLSLLISDNKSQKSNLTMLRSALTMRMASIKDNFRYLDTTTLPLISSHYISGRSYRNDCLKYLRLMLKQEKTLLHSRFENKKYYQQSTSNTIIYLLAIFAVGTIILFILMISELKKRMSYQDELQRKLVDLKRSHSELEQIAFAASHDLQEPLRKIQIFGNRLQTLGNSASAEEQGITISRINAAAERMQLLIDDMVNLTSLINEDSEKEMADLNHILKNVLDELSPTIAKTEAVIHREVLPEINGFSRQFHILFKSMIDNSLKFRRLDTLPVIAIRADKTSGEELADIGRELVSKNFHRITISDNGIGFDNKFIGKIFQIFQTLHNQESGYEGKGIGLAICQRIMVNHEGYIIGYGHPEAGATFKLFFPIDE